MDSYNNLEMLFENEVRNVDYKIEFIDRFDSKFIIFTPHGGGIEPGVTEIAKSIARDDFSFYSFSGLKQDNNDKLHITSTKYRESLLLEMLSNHTNSISIHGCLDKEPCIYIGGRDFELRRIIYFKLFEKFSNIFRVIDVDNTHKFSGIQDDNISNMNLKKCGVQLEISDKLRSLMFKNYKKRRYRTTEYQTVLFRNFCDEMRNIINFDFLNNFGE